MANYWVVPGNSGRWIVKSEAGEIANDRGEAFQDATARARQLVGQSGGGEIVIVTPAGETKRHSIPMER